MQPTALSLALMRETWLVPRLNTRRLMAVVTCFPVPKVGTKNMSEEKVFYFNVTDEVERYFDGSSVPEDGPPKFVLLCGGVCAGKTTIRKQQYSHGYVLIDAAEIFLCLSRGKYYDFGAAFEEPLELIGSYVARKAVSERRNIVTEMICGSQENLRAVFEAMKAIGYKIDIVYVHCELEEAMRRNLERGDDNISAAYTEPYHQRWILKAAEQT